MYWTDERIEESLRKFEIVCADRMRYVEGEELYVDERAEVFLLTLPWGPDSRLVGVIRNGRVERLYESAEPPKPCWDCGAPAGALHAPACVEVKYHGAKAEQ